MLSLLSLHLFSAPLIYSFFYHISIYFKTLIFFSFIFRLYLVSSSAYLLSFSYFNSSLILVYSFLYLYTLQLYSNLFTNFISLHSLSFFCFIFYQLILSVFPFLWADPKIEMVLSVTVSNHLFERESISKGKYL